MNSGQPGESRFAAGSSIAGYRIEEQIGRGGMAAVFRAYDLRLRRAVALKILAPALAADKEFRARFIRESRAAAATDHAHIVPVFEAGEANGVLFIAMRFVRGGDLRSHINAAEPLPLAVVARIVSQASSALDAAHQRGLVHRDVKPGNVLLDLSEATGLPDHVYLTDFGLSKDSLASATLTALTTTGHVIGTIDYMSPEQIDGSPVDGRADQYGLACTAFELLAGMPPYGQNAMTAVMRAHLSDPPPSVTSRRRDLPAAADAVFARALAKAPGRRYGSCGDFAGALRDVLSPRTHRLAPHVTSAQHRAMPPAASAGAGQGLLTPPVERGYPAAAPTIRMDLAGGHAAAYAERTEIYSAEPSGPADQKRAATRSRRRWLPWRGRRGSAGGSGRA